MFARILYAIALRLSDVPKWVIGTVLALIVVTPFLGIIGSIYFSHTDGDPRRGAVAIEDGAFGESYKVPEYLSQGWDAADSLRFYNTTQGSALLPYSFLLALEQPESQSPAFECERNGETATWLLCPRNVDHFRYLPQAATPSNPDALPVGFVADVYKGRDYVGFTCAACHTAQINYGERALRIDGGPAMADMTGFLKSLTRAMQQTLPDPAAQNPRTRRFVARVLALSDDYDSETRVLEDLRTWTEKRVAYNIINNSVHYSKDGGSQKVEYGYARLDAFGRIFNRLLQHTINKAQLAEKLRTVTANRGGEEVRVITDAEIDKVLAKLSDDNIIIRDAEFANVLTRLRSDKPGFPDLSWPDMFRVRNAVFNPANAPVSYPFLWDITRADFVQWNALGDNSTLGPLGRNVGEVLGVFAKIDWKQETGLGAFFETFDLSAKLSGQDTKDEVVSFDTSVDMFNLQRIESWLNDLKSPVWPFCRNSETGDYYLPTAPKSQPVDQRACKAGDSKIDREMASKGRIIYADKCESCHQVIDRDDWDRKVVSFMVGLDDPEATDPRMASNSVRYEGLSGNFEDTYQEAGDVGKTVVRDEAPVAQLLTAAVRGVIATPDPDKWWPQRIADWLYALGMSLVDNPVKGSIKQGTYKPDTTANPFNSLLAYRARPLDGIWATAPYLHNGSVPSLDALLRCETNRPREFRVGSRQFDPETVGFVTEGYDGFTFKTDIPGNTNTGHEYGACDMSEDERQYLLEYLKSL